jgi:hypothetical protein
MLQHSNDTLPGDEELRRYREGNDTEKALMASYVSAGDLVAEQVAFATPGVHSFVYRILQPGYPRYYPYYRLGAFGEVHGIQCNEEVRHGHIHTVRPRVLKRMPGYPHIFLSWLAVSGNRGRCQSSPRDRFGAFLSPRR